MLSPKDHVMDRIDMINHFNYDQHKALAPTKITQKDDSIIYSQEYFPAKKHRVDVPKLYELAGALDYLGSIGFVHGDLNRKNILYTDDGYKIIDFEPDIYQIKDNVEQTLATVPYIANSDRGSNKISTLTDKIGFSYFLLRINKQFNPKDIVSLSKDYNHERYLGVSEKQLATMSYELILEAFITPKIKKV
jgi:serine/threonine protein kinase